MKKLFLALTIISSLASFASDCDQFNVTREDLLDVKKIEKMSESILAHYQQTEYMPKDVVGDFSLYFKAASTPKKIFWTLKNDMPKRVNFWKFIESGKGCAAEIFNRIYNQSPSDFLSPTKELRSKDLEFVTNSKLSEDQKNLIITKLQARKIYLEGHQNPFKMNQFQEMLGQIILEGKEEGISPKYGEPHDWSEEFKKSATGKKSIMAKFSKILLALSRGETSQYILSGTEKELETWIYNQDLNSIAPHDMIKASYKINKGDMYLTILTIENVLNRYWRISNRDNLPITRRLVSIINTFGHNGDVFGSWYHMFGMMLYGYVEGSFKAKTIGTIETLGSMILSKFEDEKQENYVNSKGGVIGGRLAKMIQDKTYNKLEFNSDRMDINYYMNLNEDFSDRLEKIKN